MSTLTLTREAETTIASSWEAGVLAPQVTPYVVICRSTTGWFELIVETTSKHRALVQARITIEQRGWDGVPVRARHAR